jgi:hypothetical protein
LTFPRAHKKSVTIAENTFVSPQHASSKSQSVSSSRNAGNGVVAERSSGDKTTNSSNSSGIMQGNLRDTNDENSHQSVNSLNAKARKPHSSNSDQQDSSLLEDFSLSSYNSLPPETPLTALLRQTVPYPRTWNSPPRDEEFASLPSLVDTSSTINSPAGTRRTEGDVVLYGKTESSSQGSGRHVDTNNIPQQALAHGNSATEVANTSSTLGGGRSIEDEEIEGDKAVENSVDAVNLKAGDTGSGLWPSYVNVESSLRSTGTMRKEPSRSNSVLTRQSSVTDSGLVSDLEVANGHTATRDDADFIHNLSSNGSTMPRIKPETSEEGVGLQRGIVESTQPASNDKNLQAASETSEFSVDSVHANMETNASNVSNQKHKTVGNPTTHVHQMRTEFSQSRSESSLQSSDCDFVTRSPPMPLPSPVPQSPSGDSTEESDFERLPPMSGGEVRKGVVVGGRGAVRRLVTRRQRGKKSGGKLVRTPSQDLIGGKSKIFFFNFAAFHQNTS